MRPRAGHVVMRQVLGGPDDLKAMEATMRRNIGSAVTASMVNYAAAPIGAKKYDSNWLASNTAAK